MGEGGSGYKGAELTERRNRIFQFPPSVWITFSLSLLSWPRLIPLSLGTFISSLSAFCPVIFPEMLNPPPLLGINHPKSEWVHGLAPRNGEVRGMSFKPTISRLNNFDFTFSFHPAPVHTLNNLSASFSFFGNINMLIQI